MRAMMQILAASCGVLAAACAELPSAHEWQEGETAAELRFTTNRIGLSIQNICVNGAVLTGPLSTGLNLALANYNALGLRFHFTRTSGSTTGCNATVNVVLLAGFGTSAGFPSANGFPFPSIGIGGDFIVFDLDLIEHFFTHLLGHTIGLKHTDGDVNPISCQSPSSTASGFTAGSHGGVAGIGDVIIPGTPPPTVGGSVMNACVPLTTDGELTSSDRSGLMFIY